MEPEVTNMDEAAPLSQEVILRKTLDAFNVKRSAIKQIIWTIIQSRSVRATRHEGLDGRSYSQAMGIMQRLLEALDPMDLTGRVQSALVNLRALPAGELRDELVIITGHIMDSSDATTIPTESQEFYYIIEKICTLWDIPGQPTAKYIMQTQMQVKANRDAAFIKRLEELRPTNSSVSEILYSLLRCGASKAKLSEETSGPSSDVAESDRLLDLLILTSGKVFAFNVGQGLRTLKNLVTDEQQQQDVMRLAADAIDVLNQNDEECDEGAVFYRSVLEDLRDLWTTKN